MRAASAPAGRFVPARFFPEQRGLIKWGPDYAPRMAAVYDLFGNGRTALKTNFSKYHRQYDADPAAAYSPIGIVSEHRNWFDCLLNAAGTACSGAVAADQQRWHRAGSRDRPEPGGGNFGSDPQQYPRRSAIASTTGSSPPAFSTRSRPGWPWARCSSSVRSTNIPLTDRSFITEARLHALRDAGCRRRTSQEIRTSPRCSIRTR